MSKLILKFGEIYSIRCSKNLVCDNLHIGDYIMKEYKRNSLFIPYGTSTSTKYLKKRGDYFLCIARIQKDNNIDIVLESFAGTQKKLLIMGNWSASLYGLALLEKYKNMDNIVLESASYDFLEIDDLRSGCLAYVHPHSAGGTNPSLVEILPYQKPILAFSNEFNERTLGGQGYFWKNLNELSELVFQIDSLVPFEYTSDIQSTYDWSEITKKYINICRTQ
jgi:glycosyltransferase involved in cell wall biosynthesis